MPTVEDYFDDETDLPLPSSSKPPRHLKNTGQKGALVQELESGESAGEEDDEDDIDMSTLAEQSRGIYGENAVAPPSSSSGKGKMTMPSGPGAMDAQMGGMGGMPKIDPNTPMGGFMGDMMRLQQAEDDRLDKLRKQFGGASLKADPTEYKGWNTVYPIYFDAKVSVQGGRRVPRKSSMWWPQATQIAKACRTLGLPSVLEPDRMHPADWENPGRVKVQIAKDGKVINPIVKNRTQLCQQLASQIRQQNPQYAYEHKPKSSLSADKSTKKSSKDTGKGKSKNSGKGKAKSGKTRLIVPPKMATRPPLAPHPIPSLEDRYPLHSPAHATGVAVSALKRDIENEKENKKKGIGMGGEEGGKDKMPKMKRVVVRGPKR